LLDFEVDDFDELLDSDLDDLSLDSDLEFEDLEYDPLLGFIGFNAVGALLGFFGSVGDEGIFCELDPDLLDFEVDDLDDLSLDSDLESEALDSEVDESKKNLCDFDEFDKLLDSDVDDLSLDSDLEFEDLECDPLLGFIGFDAVGALLGFFGSVGDEGIFCELDPDLLDFEVDDLDDLSLDSDLESEALDSEVDESKKNLSDFDDFDELLDSDVDALSLGSGLESEDLEADDKLLDSDLDDLSSRLELSP